MADTEEDVDASHHEDSEEEEEEETPPPPRRCTAAKGKPMKPAKPASPKGKAAKAPAALAQPVEPAPAGPAAALRVRSKKPQDARDEMIERLQRDPGLNSMRLQVIHSFRYYLFLDLCICWPRRSRPSSFENQARQPPKARSLAKHLPLRPRSPRLRSPPLQSQRLLHGAVLLELQSAGVL